MIRYKYKKPIILFAGINPHLGSFNRGVPFSNNKMFWYLLSRAGIIDETVALLKDDNNLRSVYRTKFNPVYKLGLVNMIYRPTRNITLIKKGEEKPGKKRLESIIKTQKPQIVCFIGKITYEKYIGSKGFSFGWQNDIGRSRVFVMHFPLRGEASVRIHELKEIKKALKNLEKEGDNERITKKTGD